MPQRGRFLKVKSSNAEEIRDTSPNARKVGCLFSVTEGIKNGKAFFVLGIERNFVLRERD